jgi:hypothetical protein
MKHRPAVIWRYFRVTFKRCWREPIGTFTLHDRRTNHEVHRIDVIPAKVIGPMWNVLQLAAIIKLIGLIIYYLWHL